MAIGVCNKGPVLNVFEEGIFRNFPQQFGEQRRTGWRRELKNSPTKAPFVDGTEERKRQWKLRHCKQTQTNCAETNLEDFQIPPGLLWYAVSTVRKDSNSVKLPILRSPGGPRQRAAATTNLCRKNRLRRRFASTVLIKAKQTRNHGWLLGHSFVRLCFVPNPAASSSQPQQRWRVGRKVESRPRLRCLRFTVAFVSQRGSQSTE